MAATKEIVSIKEIKRFIKDCFQAVGVDKNHAEIVADNLVEADYRGHFSHGLNRLEYYIDNIQCGILIPNARPEIERETAATALINGNNGLGAVVGRFSMELAIKKAKQVGIGMVTAYHSNHYGIAGIYALQAIERGCIGISCTNTSPLMVPTRAKESALGSDPLAFGAPGLGDDYLLVDMATTVTALGKIEMQQRKGERIPPGWALNERGEIETDPNVALKAKRLLPIGGEEQTGGYKGYGLALIVGTLTGILSGSNYGPNIPMWGTDIERANLGHAFIAIDPTVFNPGYHNRMGDLMGHLRGMEAKSSDAPVLVPGDPERNHMNTVNDQGGLSYVQQQLSSSYDLAKKLKVEPMKTI